MYVSAVRLSLLALRRKFSLGFKNIIDILILRLPLVFVKYQSTAGAVASTTTGNSMRWCVLKRLVFHQEEASYDSDCDANEPDDDDGRFRCTPPHRYRKKKFWWHRKPGGFFLFLRSWRTWSQKGLVLVWKAFRQLNASLLIHSLVSKIFVSASLLILCMLSRKFLQNNKMMSLMSTPRESILERDSMHF